MSLKRNLRLFRLGLFARLRKKIIGKHALGVLYATDNGLLLVGADDWVVGKILAQTGRYDSDALSELSKLVDGETNLCVIGTHIGALLIPLAKRAKSVTGYEANPDTFRLLQQNVKINDLTNVSLFNLAAGDRDGQIEFYVNTVNSGGSKIKPRNDLYAYHYDQPRTLNVDMVRLDEHSDKLFDVILMDIEGAEYAALQGMGEKLRYCRHLQIEYVPQHLENISQVSNREFLAAFGEHFRTARKVGDNSTTYSPDQFETLLDDLASRGQYADLIFSK